MFLGAPGIERLRTNRAIRAALAAVTAAVVGVIASLALTVAAGVLFDQIRIARPFAAPIPVPVLSSIDPFSLAVAAAAFLAIRRFRVNVAWVTVGGAVAGLALALVR